MLQTLLWVSLTKVVVMAVVMWVVGPSTLWLAVQVVGH